MTEVLTEVKDRVLTVTLNRPEARNALNRALMYGLWDAVTAADIDDGVDVVIITGSDPAFSAGVDLKEVSGAVPMSAPARGAGEGPERMPNGLYRFVPEISKPIIGAVNGVCVTGGLEIALQCTILVASENARFGDTHARVGIMPGGGLTVLLAQAIGLRNAIELSLSARFITAADALRLGLVNHVVPHAELLPYAQGLAGEIVGNDPRAVRRLLQHYKALAKVATLDEAHALEGVMAETWYAGLDKPGGNFEDVAAKGRAQI